MTYDSWAYALAALGKSLRVHAVAITAIALSSVLPPVTSAPAQAAEFTITSPGGPPPPGQLTARTVVLPLHGAPSPGALSSIPLWNGTGKYKGTIYPYTMVGTNPNTKGAGTTTIPTVIVPVKFVFTSFGNRTFDPSVPDPVCDPTTSALTRVENSPLFNNISLTIAGTPIGTGQFVDLYQRANFYKYTKPTAKGKNYHTALGLSATSTITVNVSGGQIFGASCSGTALGAIDINGWDAFVTGTLIPALGFAPTQFPFFLFYDVVMYDGIPANCCILGYHSAVNTGSGVQTYGNGDYDRSGDFGGSLSDTSILSHEIAEWMDDPFGNNIVPAWGHIGQVAGCQDNLENGDPLTGTLITIPFAGFNYHVQDLAFVSWFFRQKNSIGVNKQFSLFGNLTTLQPVCH